MITFEWCPPISKSRSLHTRVAVWNILSAVLVVIKEVFLNFFVTYLCKLSLETGLFSFAFSFGGAVSFGDANSGKL